MSASEKTAAPPEQRRGIRRPTLTQIGSVVAIAATVFGIAYKFWPHPTTEERAAVSDVRVVRPVTFKRFLQRQQLQIPHDVTRAYLGRRGVMVEFHYEIWGLGGKHLLLGWELSNAKTNNLVANDQSAYRITPGKNDDAGDWALWAPAPKAGRKYYLTVTIYKPQGPPYELKHFDTETFPGFAQS